MILMKMKISGCKNIKGGKKMNKVALLGFRSEVGFGILKRNDRNTTKQTARIFNARISSQLRDSSRPAFPVSGIWDVKQKEKFCSNK